MPKLPPLAPQAIPMTSRQEIHQNLRKRLLTNGHTRKAGGSAGARLVEESKDDLFKAVEEPKTREATTKTPPTPCRRETKRAEAVSATPVKPSKKSNSCNTIIKRDGISFCKTQTDQRIGSSTLGTNPRAQEKKKKIIGT